jgi:hypothetical protein
MRRTAAFAVSALLAAAFAAAVPVEAASRKPLELTVRGRSYFDAGVIVRPGSTGATNYVQLGQTLNAPSYMANASFAGGETLPGRFYLPNCCGVTVNTPNFYNR